MTASSAASLFLLEGDVVDQDVVLLARAAGLELALREFPEDVAAAAGDAQARRLGFTVPTDARDEPWPPMQPGALL
jgi:hypothetical protein